MKEMTSSAALETYIKEMCKNKRVCATNVDGAGTTVSIFVGFGVARETDTIQDELDFDAPLSQLEEDMLLSQDLHFMDDPKIFVTDREQAGKSKDKAVLVDEFVTKLYHDERSPYYHGFTVEMKTSIVQRLMMETSLFAMIRDGSIFPQLPENVTNMIETTLQTARNTRLLEGLLPMKNKYPPIGPNKNQIPNIVSWKQSPEARTHVSSTMSSQSTGHLLKDLVGLLSKERTHSPATTSAPEDSDNASNPQRKGVINMLVCEIPGATPGNRTSISFGPNKDITENSSVLDVAKKVPQFDYNRDTHKRVFIVQLVEGEFEMSKEDAAGEKLSFILDIIGHEPGKAVEIVSTVRRKNHPADGDGHHINEVVLSD